MLHKQNTWLIGHRPNVFNYINLSSSDNSGMLRWLTDELQDAEDAEERGMAKAILPYISNNSLLQYGYWDMSRVAGTAPTRFQILRIYVRTCSYIFPVRF